MFVFSTSPTRAALNVNNPPPDRLVAHATVNSQSRPTGRHNISSVLCSVVSPTHMMFCQCRLEFFIAAYLGAGIRLESSGARPTDRLQYPGEAVVRQM